MRSKRTLTFKEQFEMKKGSIPKPPEPSSDNKFIDQTINLNLMAYAGDIVKVSIESLHPYPNHPFKPYGEEKMAALVESIKQEGLYQPIIIRPAEDMAGFEILAGHNRVEAMRRLSRKDVSAIMRDVDNDKAALVVVSTNLEQRENLLPSEKAFAFKMMIDAFKNQAEDNAPNDSGDPSTGWTGDSSMAYYYIRLTELIPVLLDLVDDGRIPVKGGVELSYIDRPAQQAVWQYMEQNPKLSVKDAVAIRAAYEAGKPITMETIPSILSKPRKKVKGVSISGKMLRRYAIPDGIDLTAVVCEMLEERFGVR